MPGTAEFTKNIQNDVSELAGRALQPKTVENPQPFQEQVTEEVVHQEHGSFSDDDSRLVRSLEEERFQPFQEQVVEETVRQEPQVISQPVVVPTVIIQQPIIIQQPALPQQEPRIKECVVVYEESSSSSTSEEVQVLKRRLSCGTPLIIDLERKRLEEEEKLKKAQLINPVEVEVPKQTVTQEPVAPQKDGSNKFKNFLKKIFCCFS